MNKAGDVTLAAGLSRIVIMTNSGVRIHCKTGYPQCSQTDLSGTINSAAFVATTDDFSHSHTFDARVIYDGYGGRFWAVGVEDDQHDFPIKGRLHISVSGAGESDAELPNSWSTTYWIKYTGDGDSPASGMSFDLTDGGVFSPDHFDTENEVGHFPDRPTIAVDRDFLYICVREGTVGHQPDEDRMLMIVICKADLEVGANTPRIVTSQFIDTDTETPTSIHTLAVDSTISGSGTHRVFMVTLPDLKAVGASGHHWGTNHIFDSIRVGAFTGAGTFEDCDSSLEWSYEFTDIALDSGDEFLGMPTSADKAKGAASGTSTGIDAQIPASLFMNAMTRILDGDVDRRIWCVHNIVRPTTAQVPGPPVSQLQWYQIDLNDWPDSGSPFFERVERIAGDDPYNSRVHAFDGAIAANECQDVAVGFTRGAYYHSSTWVYPQFWKALYPYGGSTTIAVTAAGASQYYQPAVGGDAWADFAGVVADPDPNHSDRFYGHHMTAYADASGAGTVTEQWESWLASWVFGECDSSFMADLDQDQDVDADDVTMFDAYAQENNMAADMDQSEAIDALDLLFILNAVGTEQP